jgi:hypothetical protein
LIRKTESRDKEKYLTKKLKEMKKILIVMALLLGMSGMVFPQGMGEIRGKVVDQKTGETMPGVNVVVKTASGMIGAQTDVKGNFVLKPLASGVYTVEVSFVGYKPQAIGPVSVQAENITAMNSIALWPGIEIKGAEKVEYVDPLIKPQPLIVIPPKEFNNMAGHENLKKIISNFTPDAYATDDGALYFRGARDDDFVYYVDGMKQQGGDVNLPSIAIGSIQVYTGGVPARYGDFTGGCIVIETQSYNDWKNSRRN